MNWPAIAVAAAVVAVAVPFGFAGGWWLYRMDERASAVRFWPVLVFVAATFVFAVGVTSVVAQLDLS